MKCAHVPAYPQKPVTFARAVELCSIVDGRADQEIIDEGHKPVDGRACTMPRPGGAKTRISRQFWDSLGEGQRAAVIAHESAHRALGLDVACESCADKVGGFLMRSWGFSCDLACSAMGSTVSTRPGAGAAALEGARAAERLLAREGIEVKARALDAATAARKAATAPATRGVAPATARAGVADLAHPVTAVIRTAPASRGPLGVDVTLAPDRPLTGFPTSGGGGVGAPTLGRPDGPLRPGRVIDGKPPAASPKPSPSPSPKGEGIAREVAIGVVVAIVVGAILGVFS